MCNSKTGNLVVTGRLVSGFILEAYIKKSEKPDLPVVFYFLNRCGSAEINTILK